MLSVNWFNLLESVVSSAYIMKLDILLTYGKALIINSKTINVLKLILLEL